MSRSTRVVAALVLVCLAATAAVGAQGRAQFGVGGSVTFPTGEFHADQNGDGFNAGWQGMALLDFQSSRSPLGFQLDGGYSENAANSQFRADLSAAVGQPSDAKIKMLGGNVDLTYHFRGAARVRAKTYVLGGIGLCRVTLSVSSGGITADTTETKFAWNVGWGATFPGRAAALFVEVRYVHVAAISGVPSTNYVPLTVGARFGR